VFRKVGSVRMYSLSGCKCRPMIMLTLRSIARETRVKCLSFVIWALFNGGKVSFSPACKICM